MDRIVRMKEITEITKLSRSTIQRKINDGSFPSGLKIGKKAVGWRQSEIEYWIDNLESSR